MVGPLSGAATVPRQRKVSRIAAALLLLAVVILLGWGVRWQQPMANPFQPPGLFAWLFTPEPHRAYGGMPVVSFGGGPGLVPRGLCAEPDSCGGLVIGANGGATFQDVTGRHRDAAQLHLTPGSGQLFAITPAGELVTLADDGEKVWREAALPPPGTAPAPLDAGRELLTLHHGGPIIGAAFSSDGTRLATASHDATARVWDAASGTELLVLRHEGQVYTVAFSPDGTRILTRSDDRTARVWDATGGKELLVLNSEEGIEAVFAQDGTRIVTASNDGTARVWDAANGVELLVVRHDRPVAGATFSPDGTRIATASHDGTARVWDASDGREILRLLGHEDYVYSVAFSPDGVRIATASGDGTARIWDVATGNEILALNGHDQQVFSAAFSPDGSRLVTASEDHTARLWDAADGRELLAFRGHTNSVFSAVFSPDGAQVLTASADMTARLWSSGLPAQPVVRAIDSTGAGEVWVVGSTGYAAHSRDGVSWDNVSSGWDGDLHDVAAIAPDAALALTAENGLLRFFAPTGATDRAGASLQTTAQTAAQAEEELKGETADLPVAEPVGLVPEAGERRLHALAFRDESVGWVAGQDGLILHTQDGGKTWSKLHDTPGLNLSDLVIESSGVGWALGRSAGGSQIVVAANNAEAGQGTDNGWRELPHHVGPWWFLLGVPALLIASFLNMRAWRADPAPPETSIEEVAISDEPLRWSDPDARILKPLAGGLSRFLRNVNTKPPLTLAITGRWGSGKSSLMSLLMADLKRYSGRAVWFNAWHHREEEHLLAALFETIRREAPPGWWSWPGLVFRARLFWRRSKRPLLNLAYIALFAMIGGATLFLALPNLRVDDIAATVSDALPSFGGVTADADNIDTWQAAVAALAGSGGLALFMLWLRGKLTALPANPAKLAAALARRASLGDFSDKLAFRSRFGEQFDDVCRALLTRTSPGLVIMIDDLDRCQPEDVLKVLEAVNYLVSAGPCTIVLGMDRRQVEYCVGLGFEKLVEGLPDEELIYAGEENPDKSGKQRAFARHYLEKLINIEVPVPLLDDAATDALLLRGADANKPDDSEGPGWLAATKRAAGGAVQIARVGLLAFVIGMLLTWGIEQLPGPSMKGAQPENETTSPATTSGTETTQAPASALAPVRTPAQESEIAGFKPAQVALGNVDPTRQVPAGRRWLWWSPTILLIGVALLFGAAVAVHRDGRVVRDSPDFAKALRCVKPLLAAMNVTPRAIKRYQNRMRYLAARLRPPAHEPDRIDSLLHWLGRRIRRPLVPAAWFEERPPQVISEPALILLGAVEIFAPKAFASPAEFFASLERAAPGDERASERAAAWAKVRQAFGKEGLKLPSAFEIASYAVFVMTAGRTAPHQAAEVLPFARDPGSQSA
jgi:WD40 repeat protein